MSKNDKDWTLVNGDGSLETDSDSGSSKKSKGREFSRESDSDQDFEVLAKPIIKPLDGKCQTKFKGIFIKEDHFADGTTDDGSDIEVIKRAENPQEEIFSCSDVDDKDSIEIINQDSPVTAAMINSDYGFEKLDPVGRMLSSGALDDSWGLEGTVFEEMLNADDFGAAIESETDYDGLADLFEVEESDEDDDGYRGIAALFDGLFDQADIDDERDESHEASYTDDAQIANDGIFLTTSTFIILLCLSVSAGFFIGKGLSYLSQKYEVNNPISNEGFEKTEIPNSLDRKSNGKSFNSIMNDTSHQGLTEEVKRSKNESFDAMKIRIVYEEMQLRYLRLEKKYRNLDKQYRTQKQSLIFSKKMQSVGGKREDTGKNSSDPVKQSNMSKEMLWWKMRTAVWRRKYLDLKVMVLRSQNASRKDNITFKACAGLLTRYIPELNVTALLEGNRIAKGAKMCWKKVLSPVKVVGQQMGSGLYGFSRKVDGLWKEMKTKWNKPWSNGKQASEDVSGKMTSKWRNFRRMFRLSNIVGSFGAKKYPFGENEEPQERYCPRSPVRAKSKAHGVTYPPPEGSKTARAELTCAPERAVPVAKDGGDYQEDENPLPCSREDHGDKFVRKQGVGEVKDTEEYGDKDGGKDLKAKEAEFERYQKARRNDLKMKREILEKKMRQHSNKKRKEKDVIKKKEKKLERTMKKLHSRFERVFDMRVKELKTKRKAMEKKLKKNIEKNKRERERLDKERKTFTRQVTRIQSSLREAENTLQQRKAEFEKWSKETRGKMARESAEGVSRRFSEEVNVKRKHHKDVEKMKAKMKRQEAKMESKNRGLNVKVEQLRSALRRLLREEDLKQEQIKKTNDELRVKENQVEMVKQFYADSLKREKEKHEQAKDLVRQMEQRVLVLKDMHEHVLQKYKSVQERLSSEIEKLKSGASKTGNHKPSIYCPDQNSCDERVEVKRQEYSEATEGPAPSVFCPKKDSCSRNEILNEYEEFFKRKVWGDADSELKVIRRSTAANPVPPDATRMGKVNPFFTDLDTGDNSTSSEHSDEENASTEPEAPVESEQNSDWYFSLMKERAEQRAVPLSWYIYWSQGRSSWRDAPDDGSEDNWYLRFMQERERQRRLPVDWYFQRGKGREEIQFHEKTSWYLSRGKGREDARRKEGFYYCW